MPTKKHAENTKTMKDLFLMELMDMYDAEQRIAKGLEKMVKLAESQDLKDAFEEHLRETQDDVKMLEEVFEAFSERPKAKKCDGIVGILEEGDSIAADFKGSPACDAALISAAQKVEHYEIASYGCLQEWAELLGNEDAAATLKEILDGEKATDELLTDLARSSRNKEAAEPVAVASGVWEEESEMESEESSTPTSSSKRSKK